MNSSKRAHYIKHVILLLIVCLTSITSISADYEGDKLRIPSEAVTRRPERSYGNPNPEEGPWPECVGQLGTWCQDYVANWIGFNAARTKEKKSVQVVSLLRPYEYVRSRVWIHVDDDGIVILKPARG
mmetsp:Transcript_3613/g.4996  ORF Transcript_3613/g.4996 Transcript_3613/m.4996 type:complete len:127 (+) Transcript_3613:98-478(+)